MKDNAELLQICVKASQAGALAAFGNKGKTLVRWKVEEPAAKAIASVLQESRIPLNGVTTDSSGFRTLFNNELTNEHTEIQQHYALVDPVDNMGGLRTGLHGSTSVVCLLGSSNGNLPIGKQLKTPRVEKLFCGPDLKKAGLSLEMRIPKLIGKVRQHLGIDPSRICVNVLSRPRNQDDISDLIAQKVEVILKPDGDFLPVVKNCMPDSGCMPDSERTFLTMGIGNQFQAYLASAITRCMGGIGWVKQDFEGTPSILEASTNPNRIFSALDLIPADTIALAVSGIVTAEGVLNGIEPAKIDNQVRVSTLVFCRGIEGHEDGVLPLHTEICTLPES